MRKVFRFIAWLFAILMVLALVAALVALWVARGSLAQLDGNAALPGLSAPVDVQRDALGVATVDAANEAGGIDNITVLCVQFN